MTSFFLSFTILVLVFVVAELLALNKKVIALQSNNDVLTEWVRHFQDAFDEDGEADHDPWESTEIATPSVKADE